MLKIVGIFFFQLGVIMNKAAKNTFVHFFFMDTFFVRYITKFNEFSLSLDFHVFLSLTGC